jgi:hypothetical protein
MPVPCLRDDSPRDINWSDEALFLQAMALAAPGFNWMAIAPEDRGDWARRVLEWEAKHGSDER